MSAFLFKVVSTNPDKVNVKVFSNTDTGGSLNNGFRLNGRLIFTWLEWQEFALLHGWKDADIARCKMLVVGTGEPIRVNGKDPG